MGALDRANFGAGQPFAPIDRASANRASGGKEAFERLVEQANRSGVKLVVDATTRLSIQGLHRKYRYLTCHSLDEKGMAHITLGSDGLEHQWNDSVLLNYRKKEAWDLFVSEICAWGECGAKGIRIDSAHCSPLILRPNLDELLRLDSDGLLHYSEMEVFHGDIVLPFSNEAVQYGVLGTQAIKNGYPNPFFIKATSELWRRFPSFMVLAEVYWDREISAIVSGLIPYASGLPRSLASVFGTGLTKDGGRMQLSQRQSVKAFYDWYELERMRFPQNSILLYGSSHYTPYPTAMYGVGAWAAVDLLFLLPEVPITFVGEQAGWNMSIDVSTCEFKPAGSAFPLLNAGISSLTQIRGHYVHRAKLRRQYSVLRDGGMILLYAKYDQRGWHERVFAFARFKYKSMAIVAINFNDVDSVFYIDFAPLKNICDDDFIYKRADLIDPTKPPVYFSLHELLAEKQFVELKPFQALCWGISREVDSPSTRRVLFEHSIRRLHSILEHAKDPTHNLVYSKLTAALHAPPSLSSPNATSQLDQVIQEIQQHLTPSLHDLFPQLLQRTLHHCALETHNEKQIMALLHQSLADAKKRPGLRAQVMVRLYTEILQCNTLGPLVFVTPEIGRFSTVGGIGVMVDELTQDLVSLGCDITVISPYYNFNRHGKTDYLANEGMTYQGSMLVHMGNETLKVGYHHGVENGVKYFFLHHFDYFPTPYHSGSPTHQLKSIVLMAKASLELCCQLQILPAVVITNDWFTGLVPAYGSVHSGAFGTVFSGTTFFHLVHNLEVGYEGKIYLEGYDDLSYIHNLPRELIIDPTVSSLCVNASRCALLTSTNWGTVSLSYRQDLLTGGINPSPLRPLLCRFPHPFAHSNGIRVAKRRELISNVATTHAIGKKMLQEKYFVTSNPAIPVLSFVGRICEQKGVHLILNSFERLHNLYGGRIQVIIGGMANKKDTYAAECAWKMRGIVRE
jgi:starch synthase